MKVLFIAKADLPDFQSDMIFHGGRSVLGSDFVDANRMWYMYEYDIKTFWKSRVPKNGTTYGRGFTLYGRSSEESVDRDNLRDKIQAHYFDKIIYGSVTRCSDYLEDVVKHYSSSDVIFIDGEDNQDVYQELLRYGKYYKRELMPHLSGVASPINFGIPKELIVDKVPLKHKDYASIIPGDFSTYIYDNEADYYEDYQKSHFGVTFKKAGWDCLRHYEILMNGCIPYFPDLQDCPQTTMMLFPKDLVLECNSKLANGELTSEECGEYAERLLEYTKKHLTTEYIFNKLIHG